ncbi:MAG: gliding motility-associated C-terminal domain-containing protein [Flavobacteriales bacterium]|nr:gliding motility-associated C-terminal domain-containing protein [Flavobacteriales bacterium]MCB9193283.1 gliding motility-associated C-terminal domain-containing protein [Flavobacteriales bacterium]
MWRSIIVLAVLFVSIGDLVAQPPNDDCSSAATLCAGQPLAGNNTGANSSIPGFCPPATNSLLWYSFTTNAMGGPVTIALSNMDCPIVTGQDNELSMVVLSGNGSCQPNSFTAVSSCEQDSSDFTLTTSALQPNTAYWLIVAGVMNNGATLVSQCGFQLELSGPGADIVNVDLDAGEDQQIGEGEYVQLEATSTANNYTWTPNSGLSGDDIADPVANPSETTVYTVTSEINDCTYSDQVTVEVIRRIEPPNTFTPNEDGINDTWVISGIDSYPSCEVDIYDRWGQRVFRSVGYNEPWDGTNAGAKLPVATYYYVIDLNQLEGNAAPYYGSVSIVR